MVSSLVMPSGNSAGVSRETVHSNWIVQSRRGVGIPLAMSVVTGGQHGSVGPQAYAVGGTGGDRHDVSPRVDVALSVL